MRKVLHWMFTREGGAATPRLSSLNAGVTAGVIAGVYFWIEHGAGWGVFVGTVVAGVLFVVVYPRFREEHERQLANGVVSSTPPFRSRLKAARPSLYRLAILFAALPVGAAVSIAVDSVWGLAVTMLVALAIVSVLRALRR